ncbi:MAG: RluA family pseudouridine synthase [Bryobacterales bacterium]|nr:RluA family pseudouridine synthase [Bryobacterales bacterium]MBV9398526.1 RluA family pseudouridine synthase [Bryobacterales bacterium]
MPIERQRARAAPVASENGVLTFRAEPADVGKRLDHFLQDKMTTYSRSRLQAWIKEGRALVDGQAAKASHLLKARERVDVSPGKLPPLRAEPEDLPVKILYEDEAVIAIDKPAGLIVHTGAGAHSGTLVNRLVHHFHSLSAAGGELRPGIVHRLDKETSGVLLVARTDAAHRALAGQFASRTVEKIYLALVHGRIRGEAGRITRPIARDPVRRVRMTVRLGSGRPALTEYRVLERFDKYTFLEVRIGTGRTHQIRVHLASEGHPVAGDRLYGAPPANRMFLHAWRITFTTPAIGERVSVEAPLPEELEQWLSSLRII